MKRKLNIDPRYNPQTTIWGIILFIPSVVLYVSQFFIELKLPVNQYYNFALMLLGALLLVCKDAWIKIITLGFKSAIKKFFGS